MIVAKWFINFEFPFAMGLIQIVPLIGSVSSGFIIPMMYNNQIEQNEVNYSKIFVIGFTICVVCFAAGIIMSILDYRTENHDQQLLNDYIK